MSRGAREDEVAYPPRWLACPTIGNIVNRFVPFKTPYIDRHMEVEAQFIFEPQDVVDWCKQQDIQLGLVIDLTKTSRYYKPADFVRLGVKHEKLPCEGHGVTPKEQVREFIRICTEFLSTNSDAYIGVHCTHGFNRTGYLLGSYLVQEEDMDIDDFITLFKQRRPPGIYKEDYLRELIEQYNGELEVEGVVTPEWDVEIEDLDEGFVMATGASGTGASNDLKRRIGEVDGHGYQPHRHVPSNAYGASTNASPHMIGIEGNVGELVTDDLLWKLRGIVSSQLNWKDIHRFAGSQPVSLDDTNVHLIKKTDYRVSWKADGTRYMMLIMDNGVYMIDRHNNYYKVPMRFPSRKRVGEFVDGTIVDGELVIDQYDNIKQPRYLIYDIISFNRKPVAAQKFDIRTQIIEVELVIPRTKEEAAVPGNYTMEPFKIRRKDFWKVDAASKLLAEKFTKSLGHEADGLIFMPNKLEYTPGKCVELLKWKPPHLNTIDFQVVKTGYQKCDLMLIERNVLQKSDSWDERDETEERMLELNNAIVECSLVDGRWKYLRTRNDKSHPNAVNTGRGVMQSINSGVTEDILVKILEGR